MEEQNQTKSKLFCPSCSNDHDIKVVSGTYGYRKFNYFPAFLISFSLVLFAVGIMLYYFGVASLEITNSTDPLKGLLEIIQKLFYIPIILFVGLISLSFGITYIILQPAKPHPILIFMCPKCNRIWTVAVPDKELPWK